MTPFPTDHRAAAPLDGPTAALGKRSPRGFFRRLRSSAAALTAALLGVAASVEAAPLTPGNLVVAQTSSTANNTTVTMVELSPSTLNQTPANSIAIDGSSATGLRVSGSASSTLYLGRTNDGSLLTFTGHNSTTTSGNANAILPRGVGTLDATGAYALQTTYTGTSGNQTRSATSLNNSTWFIGDQGGVYTNGATAGSPTGNFRSVKAFGGNVYVFQAAAPTVSTLTAVSGGTPVALPGLSATTSNGQDFYLISSGNNGATFDVLYVLTAGSATAGTIEKYSLVSGTWVANGVYTTAFGGFGLVAADNGNGADLYLTTGNGATAAASVLHLFDAAGFNAAINITTANNQTLFTSAAGTLVKGIAFAPVATTGNADLSGLTLSTGTLVPAFAAATASYTATVPTATTSITITPTAADGTATIEARVNGAAYAAVTSGSPSAALALSVGANTIDVKVSKGTAVKVYTVTVTRPASTDAALSSLTLSSGTLSPVFAAGTTSYEASVANSTTSVTVTPTAAGAGSTIQVRVNGGTFAPVTSGAASAALALNEGSNPIDVKVTAQDGTTNSTYTVTAGRIPSAFSSTNRDIYEPNRGTWPAAGVNVGGTQFVNLGLQGVGRVPANSIDPATGESLGSISDMQITNFVRNGNGSYTGTFHFLPDRGYNSGTIFSNYAARLNVFNFTFTPYTAATPTTLQNQIALTFTGSTRFTYDHDGSAGTPPVFTTGLLADIGVPLFGTTIPAASGASTQSDGTVTNRMTVDAEGLIFDSRAGKTGSGWVGDEYGAYVYHFNAAKQIDGQLRIPDSLVPHFPAGTVNFQQDPATNGRRVNQGFEGISQTPDGTKLLTLLQSATIQDSGAGNQGRSNARLLVYDLAGGDTPSDPIAQYVFQLPRADDTGSTTNGLSVNRNCAQSSILALNDHQFLVLARDGNGRGAVGAPVFKSILLGDLSGATNFDGSFEAEGGAVAPGGVLNATVTPISWKEALNMIGKLDLGIAEVEKFGLNLNTAPGDLNTICEKWESLGLVSAKDPAFPNDYFLFIGNDNDFLSGTGKYLDATGTIKSYDGGLENDTLVLAYRVRVVAGTNFRFTQATPSALEDAGTLTLTLTRDGPTTAAATVYVTTTDGTALAGTDYTALNAVPVTFAIGSSTATVNISLAHRAGIQGSRNFSIAVSSPDFGALGATNSATATIVEADGSFFTLSSATNTVREDAGKVTLTINRTGDTSAATVNLSTANGTAIAGTDYQALTSFAIPFTAGQAQKTVDITVINRPGIRAARIFTASLESTGPAVVLLSPSSTTVTISEADTDNTLTGPSSSNSPYLIPIDNAWRTTSVLSVGDAVPLTGTTTGQTYQMVGIPDGLGAFDNKDGTLTLLMNHELTNAQGGIRSHGAIGAFVSAWVIDKSTLQVRSGADLMQQVYNWNSTTQLSETTVSAPIAFSRFCSADLPAVSAFYNAATGLGTQTRIFMDGEESTPTGYAIAHVASGPDKGKSYILGKFNLSTNGSAMTGVGDWENILANPFAQDKTVVIGTNDGGTGIMNNAVSVYVGTKTNAGTEADKAGLTNGTLKFVNVAGNPVEITDTTNRTTSIVNGTRFTLSASVSTVFSRPEDGAWNPANLRQFYFVTTDRLDQVADSVGAQIGRTRLWRLTFDDITNPDAGGSIDLLLTGGVGNDANMWDNMTVTAEGLVMLQEDVGGAPHNGKVWQYDPATGSLKKVLKHDPTRFGDINTGGVVVPATAPFNNDEEGSGIVDVTTLFGGNVATGEHYFFTSDQAHYAQPSPLVEGGQLILIHQLGVQTGVSSSSTPYVVPTDRSFQTTSVLTVGDTVPLTGTTTGQTYSMVGIPDGLGAFDNNDGTLTLLMNHELTNAQGGVRAHGAIGAFVSSWIIDKATLQVRSGADLMQQVYNWNSTTQVSDTTTSTIAFSRFCSADLPPVTAFYNAATGLGTQTRIFMDGEESTPTGYALAHVASGTDKGKTYILGKFNLTTNGSGLTGVGDWENIVANPFAQDKTVVIGTNDGGTGIMNNAVSVYVGTKKNTGTEADKAGLTNGTLKFVSVTGNTMEIVDNTTRATNITNGTRFSLSATASTVFSRPEDGAWNTLDPKQFYFVTTDRLDQVADGIGTQIGRTRLWRLTFDDITNPDAGGVIDLLVTGGVGNDANMWDNMTVNADGRLLLQEDVGGAPHNGKVWLFDPATGLLKKVLKHDASRFGDIAAGSVVIPATAPFTNDEETSGIVDVSAVFNANTAAGEHVYFTSDQAHYGLANPLVEGGQLVLVREKPALGFSFSSALSSVTETGGTVTLTINRIGALEYPASVAVSTEDGTATAGQDFTVLNARTVNFAAGQSQATVNVTILNRPGLQGDRTFGVKLVNPSDDGVVSAPAKVTVTITEGDAGFAFSSPTASVREDAGKVTLTINRTGSTSAAATINVSTADGTGVAGTDYVALSNFPVAFSAGQTQKTVDVSVINRGGIRAARTFAVNLSTSGAGVSVVSPATATVTITEADTESLLTGPSSSSTPYVLPIDNGWRTTSVLTVGDTVPLTGTTTGQTYSMAGIPDGLGAFDNNDGTLTLLMNHELTSVQGGIRAHGSIGAFVSSWIINKSTLQVMSGADLMQQVYNWNSTTQMQEATATTYAFSRFCSADLPAVTAFFNPATGLGTQTRIFMDGEESTPTGYAIAHVASGADKGKSYILGKFNLSTNGSGLTGVGDWENILANPFPQDKTVVIGTNDGGTGIMNNAVSVYIGTKTNAGTEADKAGLTNGTMKFVNVGGNPVEITDTTTRATNIFSGTRFALSATTSTVFSRPEDGAWNPADPKQFYFVTTDRLDQVADNVGAQIGRTRLWRLTFDDITNPDAGGVVDLLATGGVGNDANMWDNLTVTADGLVMLQEDVGGAPHNGKVWQYNPVTGSLKKVLKHDPARFGEINAGGVVVPATAPFNNDEETSGIIDVTSLFGGNTATGEHYFFTSDQAHYPQASPLVEGGQLVLVHQLATQTGLSSSSTPYVVPMDSSFQTTAVLTVGDSVPLTGTTSGQTYFMVGIPDGLGAFDNGDGTLTLLMNHELTNVQGGVRAHGAIGAFVSSWIIDKSNLRVLSGSDLMRSVYNWNATAQASETTVSTPITFSRFCSADLPAVSAFYNSATGLGTQTRIFMDGEESNPNGYALAHVASGPDKGKSYILGKFNLTTNGSGLTGVGNWENIVANPFPQDKTIVAANNDGGTGIMSNSVLVYVGTKTNAGTEADKAGLTNGTIKFVNVTGNALEVVDNTTRATNIVSGTRFTMSDTASTTFSRPEDGAWNPADPKQYYFVTTDRLDQVADGVGAQIGRTRLWRLTFDDITNPFAGGVIDLLLTGGVGNDANMWDNMAVNADGRILLQEDVGGAPHNGKVWQYDPAVGTLKKVLKHDSSRFGDIGAGAVIFPATAPFNNDEETSGIVDVTSIFGGNAASGEHIYFTSDQAHYALASPLVEGGQLVLIREKPSLAFSFSNAITSVSEAAGTVNVAIKRFGDLSLPASVNVSTESGTAVADTDFTALNGQVVNFAAGQAQANAVVTILNRNGLQSDRSFVLRLSPGASGGVIGSPSAATVTILESDSSYQIESATYTVLESAGPLLVNIMRTGATGAADVTVTATDVTAHAGTDYTAPAAPVHFAAGQMTATLSIPITNLTGSAQGTRTFTLTLTAVPAGSVIAGTPATVSITESEGNGGALSFFDTFLRVSPLNNQKQPNTANVILKRTGSGQGAVSVTVTATPPSSVPAGQVKLNSTTDYTLSGDAATVTFADGELTKTLGIPLKPTVRAGQFLLTLSNPTGGAILTNPVQTTVEVTKKDTTGPNLLASLDAPNPAGVAILSGYAQDTKIPASGIWKVTYTVRNIAGTTTATEIPLSLGAFSLPLQLQHGVNTLTVVAYDNGGNSTTKSLSVVFQDPTITALVGTYTGLLTPAGTPSNATSGLLTVTVTGATSVSGNLRTGVKTTPFTGTLDSAGNVYFKPTNTKLLHATPTTDVSVKFQAGRATATLTSPNGSVTLASAVSDKQTPANAGLFTGNAAAQKYTLAFPSKAQMSLANNLFPQGSGYATLSVTRAGAVTVSGMLADGTKLSGGGHLTLADATVQPAPLYFSLYRAGGSLATKLNFDLNTATNANTDILGPNSLWIRPAQPTATSYPVGWPAGVLIDAIGTRFTTPAGASVLKGLGTTSPNAQVTFTDGKLTTTPLTLALDISTANKATNKSNDTALKLTITPTTGLFSGTFTHSDTKRTAFSGVILQEGTNATGFGYFLSTPPAGESGSVTLAPKP